MLRSPEVTQTSIIQAIHSADRIQQEEMHYYMDIL